MLFGSNKLSGTRADFGSGSQIRTTHTHAFEYRLRKGRADFDQQLPWKSPGTEPPAFRAGCYATNMLACICALLFCFSFAVASPSAVTFSDANGIQLDHFREH